MVVRVTELVSQWPPTPSSGKLPGRYYFPPFLETGRDAAYGIVPRTTPDAHGGPLVPVPLSVAILGCWHVHAADYARSIVQHPDTVLTAVWDPVESRGRELAESF